MVMTQLDTWNEDSRRASFIDIPGQPQVSRVTSAGRHPGPTRPANTIFPGSRYEPESIQPKRSPLPSHVPIFHGGCEDSDNIPE